MPIVYKKGSLFDAPQPRTLVHACNTHGVWGAGVAKQMADRYPSAAVEYRRACARDGAALLGRALVFPTDEYEGGKCATWIACLFTSVGYGSNRDSPVSILNATSLAVVALLKSYGVFDVVLHSPRLNAGLFNVPWAMTEPVIKHAVDTVGELGLNVTWNVWTP